jgi:beta-N-acetylhexosaminidase
MRWIAALPVCLGIAFAAPAPSAPPREEAIARQWMRTLTLRQQVAQLVMVACYGESPSARSRDFREFSRLVRDVGIGGLIVNNRVVNGTVRNAEPYAMVAFLNRMQKLAKIPLIVGGDFERGASMRVANTTKFPHLMAYGAANDLEATKLLGRATAAEARALGVHWIFAPDADVNNNPDNPIINQRSFGEDPQSVAAHVKAFIAGAHTDRQRPVLTTAKHFPGHGDTSTDSHETLGTVTADRPRIDAVELVPFRAAIEAGVDSIMTAHLAVPALESRSIPATVSAAVLTQLLKEQLGFQGIVATDAMEMQGLARQFSPAEAAVRALEAGADLLLIPPRPEVAISGVLQALHSGRLARKRIEASVLKLLTAKVRVGLHRGRLVETETLSDALDNEEFANSAQRVADRAVTLVRNQNNVLPLQNPERACLFALAEGRYSQQGRRLIEAALERAPSMRTWWLDPSVPLAELNDLAAQVSDCPQFVLASFIGYAALKKDVALADKFSEFLKRLRAHQKPLILVSLANPYLLAAVPDVDAYLATFSTSQSSELAVLKVLWNEIPIEGRLPVSIPGHARIGDGLKLPLRRSTVHGDVAP